ncbi:MAG: hypothetical protein ACI8TP_000250 [Acidimicrobiales bacterium]|jgi:hypothetical protein
MASPTTRPNPVLFASLLAGGALALSACGTNINLSFGADINGSGNHTTQTYEVGDFDKIDICCGLDVLIEIEEGDGNSVEITIDDNLHEYLDVTIANGETLEVKPKSSSSIDHTGTLVLRIAGHEITGLDVGAGSDVGGDFPATDNFTLKVSSGSDTTVSIDADEVAVEASSGSDVDLSGRGDAVDIKANSGSDVRLTALEVQTAKVDASSGSNIEIDVADSIEGKASSSSDVDIWGNPRNVRIETTSSSDIHLHD